MSGRAEAVGPGAGIVAGLFLLGGILVAVGAAAGVGGTAARVRRLGYLLLLVVAAVPSWVFLPLAILVPFAGLALVEDEPSTQLVGDLPS